MSREATALRIKPLGPIATALTQMFQPPSTTIRGIDTKGGGWFGPLQPVKPIAPDGTEPRGFQYQPGQNLTFTPRANEPWKAGQLREASMYDLVRVVIENVKDQVSRRALNIRLVRKPGESSKDYARRKPDPAILRDLSSLIEFPNPEQNRSEFTRKIVDDMLVIDAASVLMRTSNSGKLLELRAVDGATITRYIDEQGYTPQPPSPAYAQLWYGIPMVDLTTNQLLYAPRNTVTYRLYGMSPVEQAINWIGVAAKRLESQSSFYTAGSIPDAIQIVPPGQNIDKIAEAQMWMNSDLAGQLAKRRQIRLIQGFAPEGKDQVLFPKEEMLSDPFDDLVIRYICFAFGTSPQRLMRMMNRATAQSADTAAEKEGLEPWLDWLCGSVWNKIVQLKLGLVDYEVTYEEDTDVDPLKQAQINEIKLRTGEHTINENREDDGHEPRNEPEADMLMVITATGPVPISADEEIKRAKAKADAMPKPEPIAGPKPNGSIPKPAEKKTLKTELWKHGPITIDPKHLTVESTAAKTALHHRLNNLFADQIRLATAKAQKLLKREKTPDEVAKALYDSIVETYPGIVDGVAEDLNAAGKSGVHLGANQVQVLDTEMIASANKVAGQYAADRAAELVGMRKTPAGKLVPNPNAQWTISETTRQELRTIVTDAFATDTPLPALIESIKTAGAFSDHRAGMIARTEVATAQSAGNFEIWKQTGVVTKLKWFLSADHDEACDCEDNEDVTVDFGTPFPSGDFFPPQHPHCICVVAAVAFTE